MRRRVSTSLTTGFLTRSICMLLSLVVFNSVNLLEFSILDLHDCIYWSVSRCFSTKWKLLLTPGGSNQIILKPFWVRQWYISCSQLWFSMQKVSKAAFNSTLVVLWTKGSQYFTAIAHALFIIGNLPSSPTAAVLLAYLLTFNDFLKYNDWNLSICNRGIARKIRQSEWTSVTEDYLFILYIFQSYHNTPIVALILKYESWKNLL